MKRFIVVLSTIIFSILMVFPRNPVFATIEEDKEFITSTYNINSDIKLNGLSSGVSYSFYIPDTCEIVKNGVMTLEIQLENMDKEKYEDVNIEVTLNGGILPLVKLPSEEESFKLEIELPKGNLVKGYNNISFTSNVKIKEDVNKEDFKESSVKIKKESDIEVFYADVKDTLGLFEYPYPYLSLGYSKEVNSIIVLNDNCSEAELSAALNIVQDFSQRAKLTKEYIKIKQYSDLSEEDKNQNIIYVGDIDNASSSIYNLVEGPILKQLKDKVFICEYNNPFNSSKKLLFIGSEKVEQLNNATKSLAYKGYTKFVKEKGTFFEDPVLSKLNKEDISALYLKNLGYEDAYSYRDKNNSYEYLIPLEEKCKLYSNSLLKLKINSSPFIDNEAITFNVSINDILIENYKLTPNANKHEYDIKLPEEALKSPYLKIKVKFNFDEEKLKEVQGENAYIAVSKESKVNLGNDIQAKRNIGDYSKCFIRDGKLNDLAVVVPEVLTGNELNLIGKLIYKMSEKLSEVDSVQIIKGQDFREGNKNYIFLGSAKFNEGIQNINSELYIKYKRGYREFKENDVIGNEKEELLNSATVQLIKSPWYGENSLLILTAPKNERINNLVDILCNDEELKDIHGDLLIVSRNNENKGFYFDITSNIISPEDEGINDISFSDFKNKKIFILSTIFIILTALSCVLAMHSKRKKGKKKK